MKGDKSMKSKLIICTLFVIMLSAFILPSNVRAYDWCVHEWSEWEVYIEPTCSRSGRQYRRCNKCYEGQYQDIPATGKHTWGDWKVEMEPTCSSSGWQCRRCSVCFQEETQDLPSNGRHVWDDWVTDRSASYNHSGQQHRSCNLCDAGEFRTLPQKVADSKQRKIINAVGKYFSAAKKYNPKKLNKCFAKKTSGSFFSTSSRKYMVQYLKKQNKDIKYDIQSVSVSGKTATAKVKVTYTDAYKVFYRSFNDAVNYSISHPGISNSAFHNYFSKQLKNNTRRYDVKIRTRTIKFSYKNIKGKWKISKNTLAIRDIANCRYEEAYKDYF